MRKMAMSRAKFSQGEDTIRNYAMHRMQFRGGLATHMFIHIISYNYADCPFLLVIMQPQHEVRTDA
jgi:hypothetical protein